MRSAFRDLNGGFDGVKGSQLILEEGRRVGNPGPWGEDADKAVAGGVFTTTWLRGLFSGVRREYYVKKMTFQE